jgi:hypothetical protein
MGNKKRFTTADPAEAETLPVDDGAWDDGAMGKALHRNLANPFSEVSPTAAFAHLCEAAILAGKALRHAYETLERRKVSQDINLPAINAILETLGSAAEKLGKEMRLGSPHGSEDMDVGTNTNIDVRLVAPQCILLSSMILVLDMYCCPEHIHDMAEHPRSADEMEMQVRAAAGLKSVSLRIRELASRVDAYCSQGGDPSSISPLVLDSFYCAASTFDWIMRESGEGAAEENLGVLRGCMGRLSLRWRLGASYLGLMEQQDIAVLLALKGT